ncbi:MAG TPA: agmatinase [Blastocatellia bacterium]|nr:agmatinase [Blastocatellia bacterium]
MKLAGISAGSAAVVGFPFDAFSSFLHGAAEAPPVIREAFLSPSSNLWTETGLNLEGEGVYALLGDVQIEDTGRAFAVIESTITQLLAHRLRPVSLGGDHSITYPILRALAKRHRPLTILHFDAHPDLYDEFDGNRYSHACPFARIMEDGLAARLVQVGIRTMNDHLRRQIERFGVEVIEMRHLSRAAQLSFDTPVYLSFDLDCLDPAFAPGVSHHEAGGLSTREAISILHSVTAPVVGADLVEFNPRRDVQGITATACGRLLKEIIGLIHLNDDARKTAA